MSNSCTDLSVCRSWASLNLPPFFEIMKNNYYLHSSRCVLLTVLNISCYQFLPPPIKNVKQLYWPFKKHDINFSYHTSKIFNNYLKKNHLLVICMYIFVRAPKFRINEIAPKHQSIYSIFLYLLPWNVTSKIFFSIFWRKFSKGWGNKPPHSLKVGNVHKTVMNRWSRPSRVSMTWKLQNSVRFDGEMASWWNMWLYIY